jgi:ribosomal-protein-alanine N-acetyltransferase
MVIIAQYQISKAILQDKQEIFLLEKQCFKDDAAFSRNQISYLLKSPRVDFYVIRVNGVIIADAIFLKRKTCRGEIARLYSLAAHPQFQRQGFGKQLMLEALEKLKQENIHTIYLEVAIDNIKAIALYRSLGFCQIKLLKDYYGNDLDAIKMKLSF